MTEEDEQRQYAAKLAEYLSENVIQDDEPPLSAADILDSLASLGLGLLPCLNDLMTRSYIEELKAEDAGERRA